MYQKENTWFDIVEGEKSMLEFWENSNIFQKLVSQNKDKPGWSFLDGPITANNPMGVHHAWGRTLKDAYQRYWAMNGRQLRYQNGFDCQGLWIEVEVEKELNFKSKRDIEAYGIDRFVQKCKERAEKYARLITRQSKRLGYWMDWENSYYTMSDENNYTIWDFLKRCHRRGLIYKGHDVMPWCPRCGTGISQHEMQEGYRETTHLSLIVRLPIAGRPKEALLVWTTTPWTLTANAAAAVQPEALYVKVRQGGWTYYVMKARAEAVLKGKGDWKIEEELPGRQLVDLGFSYEGPFDELPAQKAADAPHRLIPWKEVTAEEGTGIVHIAPGCGAEDFMLGKEFGLPFVAPLDEDGSFLAGFGPFSGRSASTAAGAVKEDLEKKNILYASEPYVHVYPHCWRCGHELLFRLVDEWFIAMDPWREEIKQVARQIKWIPSFGLELELDWLTNMRDWMISKKRYWGLALPIWECHHCRHFTVIGSLEELKERAVQGWPAGGDHSPHRPWIDGIEIKCSACGHTASRVPDVGNPWLDAGIVPYSTAKYNSQRSYWEQWIPADLVLECFPGQFRNWFYSLLAMSTMMENIPPFKTLVGHALVHDEKGEEMHKSTGNAIWFDQAAEKMGVDVMRWMFCSQELVSNLHFGYKAARLIRGKFINTLWNSYAFWVNYARLIDFSPPPVPAKVCHRPAMDRWLLSRLQRLVSKCRVSFEEYNVRAATREVADFLELLSNWYIRTNRRRFWRSQLDEDTHYAFETLYETLEVLIRLLAPMLPFLTERMYQNLVRPAGDDRPESVHLCPYPQEKPERVEPQLEEDMETVIKINALALSAREQSGVKKRQPLARLIVSAASEKEAQALRRFADLLKNELNVKEIEMKGARQPCPRDRQDLSLLTFQQGWLAFDTRLSRDLLTEGLMREFLRQVQVLRKKLGLEMEDRIHLAYRTDSQQNRRMIEKYRDHICRELLCRTLTEDPTLQADQQIDLDGIPLHLKIEGSA
jgi:isoleucyl-tRNA synthetase